MQRRVETSSFFFVSIFIFVSKWNSQIKILIEYCRKNKWDVVLSGQVEDECSPTGKEETDKKKRIYIDTKKSEETQFYSLLHEIGHMKIYSKSEKWHAERYAIGYSFKKGSLTYKINEVVEELDAWEMGEKIAKKFNLKINKKRFLKFRAESLGFYIKDF